MLRPRHLGSLARTCKVIKEAVKDALDKLKVPNTAARALLVKGGTTVERLVAERPKYCISSLLRPKVWLMRASAIT